MNYDLSQYDFLDLGCKTGGSIKYCEKRFRKSKDEYAKGIGIDLNGDHVKKARENGFDVIEQDILKLEIDNKFKFVSALDFLEHLPGITAAEQIITKMADLASDFLFIRHPSFEDMEYLEQLGLKVTWTDWEVHKAPLKVHDYCNIFNKLGLKQYCFNYKRPMMNSKEKYIVPYSAPRDTQEYSSDIGEKPDIDFKKPIYSQIDIFVALRPIGFEEWGWITRED